MQKVTMIVGEPCVGKSHLVSLLMGQGVWNHRQIPYIHYHVQPPYYGRSVYIIGRYDGPHKYPGTDRLSMACQPKVVNFIDKRPNDSFVFEGDRLGNISMLMAMQHYDLEVIYLWLRPELLAERRAIERPDQNAKFWKSRRTKIANLMGFVRRHKIPVHEYEMLDGDSTQWSQAVNYIRNTRF